MQIGKQHRTIECCARYTIHLTLIYQENKLHGLQGYTLWHILLLALFAHLPLRSSSLPKYDSWARWSWMLPLLSDFHFQEMSLWMVSLSFAGLDVKCEACQRFFRDGLTISFTKILTDEAVSGWKFEIHVSLFISMPHLGAFRNTGRCCQLINITTYHSLSSF